MAYSERLAARIAAATAGWPNTATRKMFGGICCLLNGNMVCGVHRDHLILRLGEARAAEALAAGHARPFDITGRPMKGWVMVAEAGIEDEAALLSWLAKARAFVDTLPAK